MSAGSTGPPLVFLSSFDFSCLEFWVLLPLLEEAGAEAWAVDIAGWGFTEAGVQPGSQEVLGPAERRAHLLEFCKQMVSYIQNVSNILFKQLCCAPLITVMQLLQLCFDCFLRLQKTPSTQGLGNWTQISMIA